MFKPGESAFIRSDKTHVEILGPAPDRCWLTNLGVIPENHLHPAHPTVLATMEGRELSWDEFMADVPKRDPRFASYKIIEKLEKALKNVKGRDLRGHFSSGKHLCQEDIDRFLGVDWLHQMLAEDAKDLLPSTATTTPMVRSSRSRTPFASSRPAPATDTGV
jgi:hypothetical protein